MARKDVLRSFDDALEFCHGPWVMFRTAQLHEGHYAEPQFAAVQLGLIAFDHARIFQPFEATPTGRFTQREVLGKPRIGHPPVCLKQFQHVGIDVVDFGHRADYPLYAILRGR